MLRLKKLQIDVNTTNGLFKCDVPFTDGLNIIRGDNTTGKSTCLEAVLYCLGMEELLGGRNEKTMQSVLKTEVQYGDDKKYLVVESMLTLEVSNGAKSIALRRAVKSSCRDTRLVEIIDGPALTSPSNTYSSQFAYLHDPGAATDADFGFHAYIEEFLGLQLPIVEHFSGSETKLYLQTLLPTFFIEQKSGWADFLATIPRFGIRNVKSRSIEFVLNMDVIENSRKRQTIAQKKAELLGRWRSCYDAAVRTARSCGGLLAGFGRKPTTFLNPDEIYIHIIKEEKEIPLGDYVSDLQDELRKIEKIPIPTVGNSVEKAGSALNSVLEELNTKSLRHDQLIAEVGDAVSKLANLNKQLKDIESDLRKNKSAIKVQNYGAQLKLNIAEQACPTCQQSIKDFLLSQDIEQEPLRIDQNISFLEEQRKMVITYIAGQKNTIESKQRHLNAIRNEIHGLRKRSRLLRKELVSDERQPSEAEIEKKVNLRHQIAELTHADELLSEQLIELTELSRQWKEVLEEEAKLPKDYFSELDSTKLSELEEEFKALLSKFGYTSKSQDYVSISRDTYLPAVEPLNVKTGTRDYNIRFDSSASDFIRSIWAFTCALFKVSKSQAGNHPYLLVFDEPAQHSMANVSMAAFLEELETYIDAQVIVAASFNNSESDFKEITAGRHFTLYKIDKNLLAP